MPTETSTLFDCEYDDTDFAATFSACEALCEVGSCPHLRKALPEVGEVEFYAVMDSNCHSRQPHLDNNGCDKLESTLLHLIAKKYIKTERPRPQAVTCILRSLRQDLLRFEEDHLDEGTSILDLKEKNMPLWLLPIYSKAGSMNWHETIVKVKKFPKESPNRAIIERAPLQIEAFIWKSYPNGHFNKQQTSLTVAIPSVSQAISDDTPLASQKNDSMKTPENMSSDRADANPIEVFFSYSHNDEELRQELIKHLSILKRNGIIKSWHDRDITAGAEWEREIDTHLNSAAVILLLISADFMASDYCWGVEMARAMERHNLGEARVIPIVLREVDWKNTPFSKLQALPTNAKAITSWSNRDEAFADVAKGIRKAVNESNQTKRV